MARSAARSPWLLLVLGCLAISTSARALEIDWISVDAPGNACDSQAQGCFGAVSHPYEVAKHETTNGQYVQFLNAVAATDTNALYSTLMNSAGITRSGSPENYTYNAVVGRGHRPVNYVSFYDVLRFANWLHNGRPTGAQGSATTEDGAYDLSLGSSVVRKASAKVVLTSEDEWYKAAYYDTLSLGFYDYPAGSNTQSSCAAPGATANTANCNNIEADLTEVGGYTGAESPSGTFDQGGNLWEWNEAVVGGSFRGLRGGGFTSGPDELEASFQNGLIPSFEVVLVGFRVARPVPAAPVPSLNPIGIVILLGLLGLTAYLRVFASQSNPS